jgi:hypothetical protein
MFSHLENSGKEVKFLEFYPFLMSFFGQQKDSKSSIR